MMNARREMVCKDLEQYVVLISMSPCLQIVTTATGLWLTVVLGLEPCTSMSRVAPQYLTR